MTIGQKIEEARIAANIPKYIVYNALNISSSAEYHQIITGRYKLSVYQKIMLIDLFADSLCNNKELFLCFAV